MNQLIRRQRRILCEAVFLLLATFLCGPPMGFTEEPAAPPLTAQDPPALAPEGSGPPPEASGVQERAVPGQREIPDLTVPSRPGGRPPVASGGVTQGQAFAKAAPPPIGPPGPVPPGVPLQIDRVITNVTDPSGKNIGVRGQVDDVIAAVNASSAQQTSGVRATISVESFTVYAAGMSATTYTDRPNHRYVRIPYMVGYKVEVAAGIPVTRWLSQSITIQIFCDGWETGKGSLKLVPDIARPYMEPNQGPIEQVVDFFVNGHLTDLIDSRVRQRINAILIKEAATNLPFTCNALGADAGMVGNPRDDVILYSYTPSTPPPPKNYGDLSLTLQSIKRLQARDLQGRPLYAASETPTLEVFANQHPASVQLPALQEGQQVPVAASPIVLPRASLTSLSVLVNIRQANGTQVDSASRVFGQDVNFGIGTQTIRVRKSYWTKANPTTGAKPLQNFVDAYELTFQINGSRLAGTIVETIAPILQRGIEGEQPTTPAPAPSERPSGTNPR